MGDELVPLHRKPGNSDQHVSSYRARASRIQIDQIERSIQINQRSDGCASHAQHIRLGYT
jgi:hypothetical protein